MRKQFSLAIVSFFTLFLFSTQGALASGAIIGVSPNTGSIGKPFNVNVVISSKSTKFNAAETKVKLSSNLAIQDLSLGNCNLSFLRTPTIQDPSFVGVIISTSSTNCTVYTLTVIPTAKGYSSLTFSKGSVKEFGNAAEIFSSFRNGSYTNTEALKASILGVNTSKPGLYTLYLKIYSSDTTAVTNAQVTLTSSSGKNNQQVTTATDNNGIAHFSNLQTGVYDAVVKQGFNKVGETIINVSGPNHVLSLAIDLSTQINNPLLKLGNIFNKIVSNPLLLVGVLVIGIIVGVGIALLVVKFHGKGKKNS